MVTQLPGINISLLRQQTFTSRGVPLLMSGRVTALGLGVPAFVQVAVTGPSFDPQEITFDTFAAPITGNYAVSVLADKDGAFIVQARAFLPLAIPLPGLPSPITLLPPLAVSPEAPIVVGDLVNGGVVTDEGRRLATPPQTSIEIGGAPITFAPGITIGIPGGTAPRGAPAPAFPFFPGAFVGVAPDRPVAPTIVVVTALGEDVVEGGVTAAQIVGFSLEG